MSKWPSPCRVEGHRHVVTMRHCNYSAFSGYRRTPSVYSEVRCLDTGWRWRSKAAYVDQLPDTSERDA